VDDHWCAKDDGDTPGRLAKDTVLEIYVEAAAAAGADERVKRAPHVCSG
jgi:hypothetical protein